MLQLGRIQTLHRPPPPPLECKECSRSKNNERRSPATRVCFIFSLPRRQPVWGYREYLSALGGTRGVFWLHIAMLSHLAIHPEILRFLTFPEGGQINQRCGERRPRAADALRPNNQTAASVSAFPPPAVQVVLGRTRRRAAPILPPTSRAATSDISRFHSGGRQ